MSDPGTSHWDFLAQELGAEAKPQPEAPPPPRPAPPTTPPRAKREPIPRPERPTTDWGQLAGDLGLTPPPATPAPASRRTEPQRIEPQRIEPQRSEPERIVEQRTEPKRTEPPARAAASPRSEAPARPPRHAEPRQRPPRRERVEEVREPKIADEPVELSEEDVIDVLESTLEEGEAPGREGVRRRRRRRGRGRRRGGEPTTSTSEIRVESVEFTLGDDEFEEPLDAQIIDVDALPLAEEGDAGEDGGDEERPRRRRRRRGGRRRRTSETGNQEAPAEAEGELADEEDELPLASDRLTSHEADELMDEDEDDDEDARLKGHRGIPSWDDAIGFIVGANMEARAKNPVPSRGRGRGGRDRGRSSGS